MKITCSCGIDYQVYDYPPAEIEDGGKKMMERHIMCPCDREVVVRTAPKYEPNTQVPDAEETSGVVSFDELVRRLNQDPPPPSGPVAGWGGQGVVAPKAAVAPKAPPKAVVAPPPMPSIIADLSGATPPANDEKSIFLTQDEADVVGALIANYGEKFKDPEVQKDEVQEFADLASRAKQEGMLVLSEKEQRMCRMGFLERNMKKLWPVGQYDDETDFNVVQTAKAKVLYGRFKSLCTWEERR